MSLNPFTWMRQPKLDSPEEHRISLPGVEVAIIHSLKTVMMVDMTGASQEALIQLESWCKSRGYFLHCVSVKPLPKQPDHLNVKP